MSMTSGKTKWEYLSKTGEYGRPPNIIGTSLSSKIVHEHAVQNGLGETICTLGDVGMILNKMEPIK